MNGLKMLLFLSCWITAGITAEASPVLHHRLKNSSLCIHIKKSTPYSSIRLTFGNKALVHENVVTPNYTDKVDYKAGDTSLCINKLTETDSGTYTASIMDSDYHITTETHKLIVLEAVPRPVLQMTVIHSNLSAEFCNITVNCSILDDWTLSVCDGDSCRTSQRSSFRGVNITVSAEDRSVVCRGHNHVSTSNVSENIKAACFNKSYHEQEEASQLSNVKIIAIVIAATVCLFICVFMVCVVKRRCSRDNHHQSSPADLIQNQPAAAQPQPAPRLSSSSSEAEASYENVEATRPSGPNISPREELRSIESQKIDTVYSYLQPPAGNSDSSQQAKGHTRIREESTAPCVTLDDTTQPMQIDSVYSVLQKPKNVNHSATDR